MFKKLYYKYTGLLCINNDTFYYLCMLNLCKKNQYILLLY